MLFYYVQIKDRHDPDVNIREKANVIVECHSRLRLFLSRDFRGQNALRKLLGSIGLYSLAYNRFEYGQNNCSLRL